MSVSHAAATEIAECRNTNLDFDERGIGDTCNVSSVMDDLGFDRAISTRLSLAYDAICLPFSFDFIFMLRGGVDERLSVHRSMSAKKKGTVFEIKCKKNQPNNQIAWNALQVFFYQNLCHLLTE